MKKMNTGTTYRKTFRVQNDMKLLKKRLLTWKKLLNLFLPSLTVWNPSLMGKKWKEGLKYEHQRSP